MKRLLLVVVAGIATAVAPLAVASASSHKTSEKTVSLSGGQSVSVTCSGKSPSVTKSGNAAVLVCASRPVKAPATAAPVTGSARNGPSRYGSARNGPSRHNSRPDAAAEERGGGSQTVP